MDAAVKRWFSLPDEERLRENTHYKGRYEAAAEWLGQTVPPWDDLTHEQRDKVRQECIRYDREVQAFGDSLAK